MWSAWPHARAVWAARILQHLDPDGIFVAHAGLVALTAHPVIPACDIVEAHVELVVLEVVLVSPQLDSAQLRLEESRLRLNSDP